MMEDEAEIAAVADLHADDLHRVQAFLKSNAGERRDDPFHGTHPAFLEHIDQDLGQAIAHAGRRQPDGRVRLSERGLPRAGRNEMGKRHKRTKADRNGRRAS
ncbi:MAG: hypothetical protein ACHQWU_11400 [Gemmatimonadales bacterium]